MKTLQEVLPLYVSQILDSLEFDDEAAVVIKSVKFEEENLCLTFCFRFSDDKELSDQFWQIIAHGVEEERVLQEWVQGTDEVNEPIVLYTQHPLLLEHIDTHAELYIKGTTDDWKSLFTDIYQALLDFNSNTEYLTKYIFSPKEIKRLSSQGHGLFARGPKTILKIYEQCLIRQGIKPIYIGGGDRSEEKKSLKLLKIGNSYVIGKSFHFERI